MKEYRIPLVNEKIEERQQEILDKYDVEGLELEYLWDDNKPRCLFSGVFPLAGKEGIGFSFCVEVPKNRVKANKQENKTKVFFDDCLEVFLQPENSSVYYGFEINPNGACLDYRVFIRGDEKDFPKELENSKEYDGSEKIFGFNNDVVNGNFLTFDYDWKAHGSIATEITDEFWYLDVFIPWSDFGLKEAPKENSVWKGTINRIDASAGKGKNPGFLCTLNETSVASFHQPDKFASFVFEKLI